MHLCSLRDASFLSQYWKAQQVSCPRTQWKPVTGPVHQTLSPQREWLRLSLRTETREGNKGRRLTRRVSVTSGQNYHIREPRRKAKGEWQHQSGQGAWCVSSTTPTTTRDLDGLGRTLLDRASCQAPAPEWPPFPEAPRAQP
jgi:hypothetical protein